MNNKITIKRPKALVRDRVLVFNYRKGKRDYRSGIWEEGLVMGVEYSLNYAKTARSGCWKYTVGIRNDNNKIYRLYVGDEGIK